MKAAAPHDDEPAGGLIYRVPRAVDRFFFAPADPTTLGLIRLCAGILVFYVHLAYCADLQEFFGKDAWLSLKAANHMRRETPTMPTPSGWTPDVRTIYLPADPETRAATVNYLAALADGPKEERDKIITALRSPPGEQDWGGGKPPPASLLSIESIDPWGRERTAKFLENLPKDSAERAHIFDYLREWNVDPREVAQEGYYAFSIWFHVTNPTAMIVTQFLILLITFLFAIGFCTRITSVLTWLAALSYVQRSPISLFGADTMVTVLLMYLMIGPSGAALSVDRLIVRWLARRKAEREGKPAPLMPPPQPMISANFTLRLIQMHFCIIYLASGTSKLLGSAWWNGSAIYMTMANYEFAPMRHGYYMDLLRYLCRHRWLWEVVMEGGSFFTVALEISLPFLVWNRRLRPFYVAASMTLHTMIALTMGLVIFSLLMATFVMAFIPGEGIQWLIARLRRARPAPVPSITEEEEPEPLLETKEKVVAGGTHIKAKD